MIYDKRAFYKKSDSFIGSPDFRLNCKTLYYPGYKVSRHTYPKLYNDRINLPILCYNRKHPIGQVL